MTRGTDPFWEYVESLPNKRWKCNFCGKPYAGSATRIKAHLAGVGGYGINDCKHVIDQVRLEARTQFMEGRGVAESSNRSKRNVEKGPHLPVTANNEHAWKETSFAAMPDLSSDIMSTLGAGSAFFPLLETNLPNQSLPDQIVIPDFSSCPPSRQFNAGDSSTQPPNFSYPSSDPEFWNDMVRSLMTEEGEPTIEVSRELSNGAEGNIEEGLHQPVITSNEDGPREISFADVPSLDSNAMSTIVASSSDFLPSHEMNVPSQYLPTQNMTTHGDFSFGTQPPQSHAGDSNIQQQNLSNPSSGGDLTPEAFTKMPHPVNAEEGEPNTEVPQGVPNWHDQRICVRIESCNAITARVDGQIGGDGRNLLPRNVQVLEVGGGSGVTSLSEVGPLENLEELVIEEWEKLEELGAVHFPQLQGLRINSCSKLKRLSVEGQGLPRLHRFTIIGSEELEGIDLAAPNLNFMEVWHCYKMKRVVEWDWLTTRLPNLKSIKICYGEKLEEIISGPLPIDATCRLTHIEICYCNNMKGVLLTHDMLLHIPSLQDIRIDGCEGIEVIIGTAPSMTQSSLPKLTHLILESLPELKRICDRMESCDHIQYIQIFDCPKLKRIPLRLHPLDNGLLSPPPSLGWIVTDKETWQTLEWDHPLARVSLESFIMFLWTMMRP